MMALSDVNEVTQWRVSDILNSAPVSVVVLNQPISCRPQLLFPIWERAAVRVTVDGGARRWLAYVERAAPVAPGGAELPLPHCVTGDLDSIGTDTEAYYRSRQVPIVTTSDQDETDFTKALRTVDKMLKEKITDVEYIVCVCEHSGRLDQTLANLETLHLAQGWGAKWRPVILSECSLTWLLSPGRHCIHVPPHCLDANLTCGLIPLCGPTTVTTAGLKWDLDNGVLSFGMLVSTSNGFAKTEVEIETSHNLVWTMQFLQDHSF